MSTHTQSFDIESQVYGHSLNPFVADFAGGREYSATTNWRVASLTSQSIHQLSYPLRIYTGHR